MTMPVTPLYPKMPDMTTPARDYIGSAHIAGILGVPGAFGSQISIAHELRTGESDLDPDNLPDAIELGNRLEDFVLDRYCRRERAELIQTQPHYRYPGWDCLGCTPDALVRGGDGILRLVDAKVTGDYRWDDVPMKYEASSQWQIGIANQVVGVTECDLAVYHLPARSLKVYRISFNRDWFDPAADFAIEWFRRYVTQGHIPPVDGHRATTDALKRLTASVGKFVNLDDQAHLIEEYEAAEAIVKAAEADRDLKKNRLMAAMGDAEIGLVGTEPRVTWKQQAGRKSLDQKALEADMPDVFARYQKQGAPFRVMRFSKKGK